MTTALKTLVSTFTLLLPAFLRYRRLRRRCYRAPLDLRGRIGMTIHPTPATVDTELRFLEGLGLIPVLLRFYCHESPREWDFLSGVARRLHEAGHTVSIALVQDRRAVVHPPRWEEFVAGVLDRVGEFVEWVEIGHAINRVKWGIWSLAEYNRILRPFERLRDRYPSLRLMGPAVNDFEYHHAAAALAWLPRGVRFDGLSLHLYVDRRGPPENRQKILKTFGFAAIDKFTLARALARRARRCGDRVIVSEVNWFLKDTHGYAHPFAPYAPNQPMANEWDVSEELYADYMLRYYLHAICSGMVDTVFWWRLVSPAFGLVNDSQRNAWRARPAYEVLKAFLARFHDAAFVERLASDDEVYLLLFRRPGSDDAVVAFRADGERSVTLPFRYERAENARGEPVAFAGRLAGHPLYFFGVTKAAPPR